MGRPAILCVDDEAIILMALKQELRRVYADRFIYESALNAEDALAAIDEMAGEGISVILVISDWLMPGMRGDEFLLRVNQSHPEVRCIVVTGHADQEALDNLRSVLGDVPVIGKPWRKNELYAAVDSLVM
ncbi:MAG: response regulator [Spirochaetales bacterium]|nr:response regulator [Spirochaetales bacterium]